MSYGIKIKPPTKSTAQAFGSSQEPNLLPGGQKTTYRAGDIILKPASKSSEPIAEIFSTLKEVSGVRFSKPIKSTLGGWVHDGYVAWTFLKGEHSSGEYSKKLEASRAFHRLLNGIEKPEYLNTPNGSWSTANWIALDQKEFDYDQDFFELYNQIKPHLKPLPTDNSYMRIYLVTLFVIQLCRQAS